MTETPSSFVLTEELCVELATLQAENERLREALQHVCDCFQAAMFEGLSDRLVESDYEPGNLGVWIVRNSWGAIIATVATYDEALVKAHDV